MNSFIDGGGVYGAVAQYAMVLFLMGSSLVFFIYLWKKDRLDMDEQAKYQMMDDSDD